ncbi:hypothetical protein [Pseudonocardia xishanensis]|uniref:Enoyl-ACP reductase-like protein n=1 Tax=Pseudonocardia xishanensis TaxID=630995 RepID=A0ABP8RVM3_9PSEU
MTSPAKTAIVIGRRWPTSPAQRTRQASEVANVVALLLSDDPYYVTGTAHAGDGALTTA